jgi:GT2 family glycosyltransferase
VLSRGEATIAAFDLDEDAEGPPPLLPPQQAALLHFLVGTGAGALKAGTAGALAAFCHGLARAALAPDAEARALCRPGATLSLWSVPPAGRGAWHLLARDMLRRIGPDREGVLALPGPPPGPDAVLLPPRGALPLRLAPRAAGLPGLRDVLARALSGEAAGGARILATLGAEAAAGGPFAALLREAQLTAPARARQVAGVAAPVGGALDLALADGAGGVFIAGWLRDPLGLVAGMELRSALARRPVPAAALHRLARPDLAADLAKAAFGAGGPAPGFVAHLPDADHPAVAQWRLALRLASGEAIELTAPPARLAPTMARDMVLRAIPSAAVRPALLEACIAPAAWRLHRAAMADAGPPEVLRIGTPPRRPRAALVIPLWRNLGFLRFQLAAFARDAALRGAAEIVYVLDSPEQRGEVEHLLRGMSALHGGLGVTLVVMPVNRGYASACNAGAEASTAPVIGFLNSDVIPAGRDWLDALLGRLARDRRLAAVGPKLLFDDGAIQHAGLLFRRAQDGPWFNDHYFKGFPRHHAEACVARRVPGVTGAALFVRRTAFDAAGRFSTDYIIGDFEDSDLCLALRAQGGEIFYEPAAELFHFERQSIPGHSGHARSLASACNRLLQHNRWDGAIARLMARFPVVAG